MYGEGALAANLFGIKVKDIEYKIRYQIKGYIILYRLLKTVGHKTNSSEICFGKLVHQIIWKIGKQVELCRQLRKSSQ